MNLKQSIVVVNEFTVKGNNGKGSRGSSPRDYVLGYMARGLAVEDISLGRLKEADDFMKQMLDKSSAMQEADSIPEMKHSFKKLRRKGGVAFGNQDIAMSDEKLRHFADFVQSDFDQGKTIFKTVLSFDLDWLKEHGLIEDDFEIKKRGDFKGHVDQLKLRFAILYGLEKMSRNFDDLRYAGTIQIDTKHLHVHLAMVDHGHGRVRSNDGKQKGMLTDRDKSYLRRGIDQYLDRKQMVKNLSASVMYDKRNTLCYVKRFAYETIAKHGFPQFLIACLPSDRRLWRASTNRKEMRKANAIVREYVTQLLSESDSGFTETMQDIINYADYRKKREGLTDTEYEGLVRNGQDRIVKECMNGVYSVLRQIPENELKIQTPMIDVMAMDYESMAAQAVNNPLVEFGFRLRSYSSRLNHHRQEYHRFRDEYRAYEQAENKSEDSKMLGRFLKVEQDYNAMCMVKYQYFLSFLPPEEDIEEDFLKLMKRKRKLERMKAMQQDKAFERLSADSAYDYAQQVYHQRGGDQIRFAPTVFQRRVERLEDELQDEIYAFREKLRDYGLDFDGTGVTRKKMYSFSKVKALDLHHMGYDFPYDYRISRNNLERFCEMADIRYHAYQDAKQYLLASGQERSLSLLPEKDIYFMKEYADKIRPEDEAVIQNIRPAEGEFKPRKTISLDKDYISDIETIVKSTVQSVHMEGL